MNISLLLKIKEQILSTPFFFDMSDWSSKDETGCLTTACIAGWAVQLSPQISERELRDQYKYISTENIFYNYIHFTVYPISYFTTIYWPEKFKLALSLTDVGTLEYAQVAADYIDYYIATYA